MAEPIVSPGRWSEDETFLALFLYFQLPFGKLHTGNLEIQQLAHAIGRSSNSVAMKLCNFASLDPKITDSDRKGLSGASKLDREIYSKFVMDWSGSSRHAEVLWQNVVAKYDVKPEVKSPPKIKFIYEYYEGETTVESIVERRIGQGFFRRIVLANYSEECCITGISEPRLLVASHIVPWNADVKNRHNPANGLLLSGTFYRGFDSGLISVDVSQNIHISKHLLHSVNLVTKEFFAPFKNKKIRDANRFSPDPMFLDWHFRNVFIDNAGDIYKTFI